MFKKAKAMNYHSPIATESLPVPAPLVSKPFNTSSVRAKMPTTSTADVEAKFAEKYAGLLAIVELTDGVSSPMVNVVKTHLDAWHEFDNYCVLHDGEGPRWNRLNEAEEAAMLKLAEQPALSPRDLSYKAAYLAEWSQRGDLWARDGVPGVLLQSMIENGGRATDSVVELGKSFQTALKAQKALELGPNGIPVDEAEWEVAHNRVHKLMKQIASHRARSMAGIAVKLAAFDNCVGDGDTPQPKFYLGDTTDCKLAASIIRDLYPMLGATPQPKPEHPWEKARRLAAELSDTLMDCDNGSVVAVIEPSAKNKYAAVLFAERAFYDEKLTSMKEVSTDDELLLLCSEWREAWDACTNAHDNLDDTPEFNRLSGLEQRIAAIRPVTAAGFAAKLVCLTNFGDFTLEGGTCASVELDAEALAASVGIVRPTTMTHNRP